MYFALIGDIVNSKNIDDRYRVQEKLNHYMKELNQQYDSYLASGFAITLGDEFQALFTTPQKMFEIIAKIEVEMKPIQFRFAIGVGPILTSISKRNSIGSDGPAWWRARDAIVDLKNKHERGLKEITNIRIIGLDYSELGDLINISLAFSEKLKNRWTPAQQVVINYLIKTYGLTTNFAQNEVATQLNITAPDLNKKLKSSNYYDYVIMLDKVTNVLMSEVNKGET